MFLKTNNNKNVLFLTLLISANHIIEFCPAFCGCGLCVPDHVCKCASVCVCVFVFMFICLRMHLCVVCVCLCSYVCGCTCMCVVCICVHVFSGAVVYVFMFICLWVQLCVCESVVCVCMWKPQTNLWYYYPGVIHCVWSHGLSLARNLLNGLLWLAFKPQGATQINPPLCLQLWDNFFSKLTLNVTQCYWDVIAFNMKTWWDLI